MVQDSFKGKKLLITGGGGFVGSHLVKRCLNEGAEVFLINRTSGKLWRIKDNIDQVKIFNFDITNTIEVQECVSEVRPHYIFNLAAYGVNSDQGDYITAANTNIIGIINILKAVSHTGCNKIINIGSCAEYGDRRELMREDMNPRPVSIYGSTKACATIVAHQIAKENNMKIVTLRPFGIFGEGEDKHKVFCHIITSILEGKDVKLSSCEQYRDYCYVENVIDAMVMAAINDSIENEIFNVASGKLFQLKHYVDLIFKHIGTDKKPLFGAVDYRKNEMWAPSADIGKIQALLGWYPKIDIEEAILRTINWYKQNINLYK